jgi:hypothetical protein
MKLDDETKTFFNRTVKTLGDISVIIKQISKKKNKKSVSFFDMTIF